MITSDDDDRLVSSAEVYCHIVSRQNEGKVIEIDIPAPTSIHISNGHDVQEYNFDGVCFSDRDVFEALGRDAVSLVLRGFNTSIISFG